MTNIFGATLLIKFDFIKRKFDHRLKSTQEYYWSTYNLLRKLVYNNSHTSQELFRKY